MSTNQNMDKDTTVFGGLLTTTADPFLSPPVEVEDENDGQLTQGDAAAGAGTRPENDDDGSQQTPMEQDFGQDHQNITGTISAVPETIEDIMKYINEPDPDRDPEPHAEPNFVEDQSTEQRHDFMALLGLEPQPETPADPDPVSSTGIDPSGTSADVQVQAPGSELQENPVNNLDETSVATTTPMDMEEVEQELVAIASTSKGRRRSTTSGQKRPRGGSGGRGRGRGRGRKSASGAKKAKIRGLVKEDEFVIEAIVDKKFDEDGVPKYFVKWWDWPSSSNTWEPKEHLVGFCDVALAEFEAKWEKERQEREERAEAVTPPLVPAELKPDMQETQNVVDMDTHESGQQQEQQGDEQEKRQEEQEQEQVQVENGKEGEGREESVPGPVENNEPEGQQEGEGEPEQGQGDIEQQEQEQVTVQPPKEKRDRLSETVVDRTESSSPPLEYMEFDVLEECPPNKIPKELFTVLKLSGILVYVVVWKKPGQTDEEAKDDPFPDRSVIKAEVFQQVYPKMVIKFYEQRISFKKNRTREQILQERAVRALKIAEREQMEEKENIEAKTPAEVVDVSDDSSD